jgi:hypothetical protein
MTMAYTSIGTVGTGGFTVYDTGATGITYTTSTVATDDFGPTQLMPILQQYIGQPNTDWIRQRAFNDIQYYTHLRTNVGTEVYFDVQKTEKAIHPRLYFKYIKSKLNKLQERKLNERLLRLQKFVKSAEELGQKALFEEFSRKIAITVREQEVFACGIEYFVDRWVIDKFRGKVKDVEIGFSKLSEYTRPVPDNVASKIKKLQELSMFDDYWILYLNYQDKKDVGGKKKAEVVKTNKEKIKEKDPIVFGIQDYLPDKLYFIADWVDEYCDLTLDKLLEDVKKDDPDYDVKNIEDIDEDYIKRMVQESRERHLRLKGTNSKNFRKHMEDEDEAYAKSGLADKAKKYANSLNPKLAEKKEKVKKRLGALAKDLTDIAKKITRR